MLTPCHPNPRSSPSSSSSSPLVGRSSDHSPYVRNDTWSVTSSDKRPPAPPAAAAPIWGGLCYFNTTKLAVTVAGVIYIWKQISMFTGSLGASWLVLVNGYFLVFVALCMCTRTLNEILLLDFRGRLKTWPLPLRWWWFIVSYGTFVYWVKNLMSLLKSGWLSHLEAIKSFGANGSKHVGVARRMFYIFQD